ncbi:MAG: DUF4203 domain-containing protein [Caldilineaceae bacterium]|nr:DUF4203 domain-containing protein [Caldilineaceae bacterium]
MLAAILQILFSIVPLLFGRRLFWVFVAVAGFLVGFALAGLLISSQSELVHLLIGIVVGLIGGLLAVYFTKPMAAVGGFFALSSAALLLAGPLGVSGSGRWILFFVAGIIGALIVFALFDWALIVNSSISGATGITAGLAGLFGGLPSALHLLLVVVLLAVGIVYQARELRAGRAVIGLREPVL